MENIDITTLVNAVIALLAAIITTFVIPYIRSKTTENQRKTLMEWVKIAVKAAEQIYAGSGRGIEKKAYVLNFLHEKGISLDETSVEAAIEAAVNDVCSEELFTIKSGRKDVE